MRSPLGRLRGLVPVGLGSLPTSGPVLAAVGAVVVAGFVVAGVMLLARGDDNSPSLGADRTRTSLPLESPTPGVPSTGIPEVDAVIDAVARGDARALAEAAVVQDISCADLPASLCPGTPSPGETARVFSSAICDDNPIQEDSVLPALAQFLDRVDGNGVHAAWLAEPGPDGPTSSVPAGSVRVMWQSGSSLLISRDGKIWYAWYGCGPATEEFSKVPPGADFLIKPQQPPSPTPQGSQPTP